MKKTRIVKIIAVILIICLLPALPNIVNAEMTQQQDFKIYKNTEGFEIVSVSLRNPTNSGYRNSRGYIDTNSNGYMEIPYNDSETDGEIAFDQSGFIYSQDDKKSLAPSKGTYVFTFIPQASDKIVLKFLGAGEVCGEKVDIEITYSDFIRDKDNYNPSLEVAKQLNNGYSFSGMQEVSQTWTLYKSGTNQRIDVGNNTYITFNRLRVSQYVKPLLGVDPEALLAEGTNILYTTTKGTGIEAYRGMTTAYWDDSLGDPRFTRNSVQFHIIDSTFKFIEGTDINYCGHNCESFAWMQPSSGRIFMSDPTTPTKTVSDLDETKVTDNILSSNQETFNYELVQQTHSLGDQLLIFYSDFSYADQIDSILDIDKSNVKIEYAKVTDPNTRINITNQFDIVYSNNAENKPNNMLVTAKSTILNNPDFYDAFVYVTIPVKIDSQYLDSNLDKYITGIQNKAEVVINSESSFTNSVTTKPIIVTEPTITPTATPTVAPTVIPTVTPTTTPTVAPTDVPTVTPTTTPTVAPTVVPTVTPTTTPTVAPTAVPTVIPTTTPTVAPTVVPTFTPTTAPTVAPTAVPTVTPTTAPTVAPTAVPTVTPTTTPTVAPTAVPTVIPTTTPTVAPTTMPTITPVAKVTTVPTMIPTAAPTVTPTTTPTVTPTATPTTTPTTLPTVTPTPTNAPTTAPTGQVLGAAVFTKLPDRVNVRKGDLVNYTLSGIGNPYAGEITNFRIGDIIPSGIEFVAGEIPAFTNGTGITYNILYKNNAGIEKAIVQGVDASKSYSLKAPTLATGETMAELILAFTQVPVDFGTGNSIVYTFKVTESKPGAVITNKSYLSFVFEDAPIYIENTSNSSIRIYNLTKTGESNTMITLLAGISLALGGAVLVIAKKRSKKQESK